MQPARLVAHWVRPRERRKLKSSLSAPRNAPLRTGRKPGAETALFLYHPYFSGAQRPDGQWI